MNPLFQICTGSHASGPKLLDWIQWELSLFGYLDDFWDNHNATTESMLWITKYSEHFGAMQE